MRFKSTFFNLISLPINFCSIKIIRPSEEQREEKKANLPEKDREKQNTYEKEVNTFFIKIMCELMDFRNKCIGEEDHLYESMKETFGKVAGF